MPVPRPRKGEQQAEFVSRFMRMTQDEFKDQKQRAAVAYKTWRGAKKKQGKS